MYHMLSSSNTFPVNAFVCYADRCILYVAAKMVLYSVLLMQISHIVLFMFFLSRMMYVCMYVGILGGWQLVYVPCALSIIIFEYNNYKRIYLPSLRLLYFLNVLDQDRYVCMYVCMCRSEFCNTSMRRNPMAARFFWTGANGPPRTRWATGWAPLSSYRTPARTPR